MLLQITDVIFEQHQTRPPTREIKPAEHLELVAFDIDREEIETEGSARLAQDVIERAHGNIDNVLRLRARRHAVTIEGG